MLSLAVQPGTPPGWRPATSHTPPAIAVVILVMALVAAVVVALIFLSSLPTALGSGVALLLIPGCAIFLVVIGLIIAAVTGAFRSRPSLPPPPPVQQQMVPAGLEGAIAINCPNCGAPPGSVDRFGVATCIHCGARFIVR